ncbi:MAG: cobalt ECF transporter T component CbiQ, partial [Eubacteriales bacterium]|nr:cobalt ECF transporter T component CbiQ [Eubacteriales bacterium]
MADIRRTISEIYSLEQLAQGGTAIHRLHPLVKLLGCITYIVCVMSFSRTAVFRLAPYVFYPVLIMALAEVPPGMIIKRTAIALPFCLFAGVSNLLFDRG